MSKTILELDGISITSFWGGKDRGTMIQINARDPNGRPFHFQMPIDKAELFFITACRTTVEFHHELGDKPRKYFAGNSKEQSGGSA